jgi:hypothetical protein
MLSPRVAMTLMFFQITPWSHAALTLTLTFSVPYLGSRWMPSLYDMETKGYSPMLPLISICGTTGVGKSKLAVELALSIGRAGKHPHSWRGARIINADSMQVYAGMDIMTNKMPSRERQGVEHLLMDFKSPGQQYMVGEWVRDAIHAVGAPFRR